MKRLLVAATVAVGLTLLGGIGTASAGASDVTLDGSATLRPNGRALEVTGTVTCTAGERVKVVVNPMSGLTAVGKTAFVCDGSVQSYALTVRAHGKTSFADVGSGPMQFAVLAGTRSGTTSGNAMVSW